MSSNELTAGELLKILENDPDFLRKRLLADQRRSAMQASLVEDQAPLILELKSVNIEIKSVYDLINKPNLQKKAIPILLKHLGMSYHDRNLEGIARALATPDAAYAWTILKEKYEHAADGSALKIGLADALSAISSEDVIAELAFLAKDPRNGESRLLLLDGLRRSESAIARAALAELSRDPALAAEIASWSRSSEK